MGKKGAKLTGHAEVAATDLVGRIASVGDVSSKKMFGGVGIFESGTMFGMVDSKGGLFLRTDDDNEAMFEAAGSDRHGKMPYSSVPASVLTDAGTLTKWATSAIAASRRAKKK